MPLYGAFALIAFAAAAIIFGQTTGLGTVSASNGNPVGIRDIVLTIKPGDMLSVTDAISGEEIASYAPQEGGFVRGSMRAFNRMRFVDTVETSQPYRIIQWENGAVTLSDTVTGERYFLNAFGPDNAAAFAKLIDAKGSSSQ
jgi:putative photosynthetic complex assembly protein